MRRVRVARQANSKMILIFVFRISIIVKIIFLSIAFSSCQSVIIAITYD